MLHIQSREYIVDEFLAVMKKRGAENRSKKMSGTVQRLYDRNKENGLQKTRRRKLK